MYFQGVQLRWEVIVGLVAIGDVDDHHCLNFFLYITFKMYVDRFLCSHFFVAKINRSILSR